MEDNFNSAIDNRGMFVRPFSFKGRIRRLEYGISMLIWFVIVLIINILAENDSDILSTWAGIGLYIVGGWFWLSQAVKRAHDRNSPGPYIIIPFYTFYLLFAPSNVGENDYGNSPKDPKFTYEEE